MIDILDKLAARKGFVRLDLTNGESVFGRPDCIVFEEDEEGWDTIKHIRFEPFDSPYAQYYQAHEIKSVTEID